MAFTPALRKTAWEFYIVGSAIRGQQMFETALLHQCATLWDSSYVLLQTPRQDQQWGIACGRPE